MQAYRDLERVRTAENVRMLRFGPIRVAIVNPESSPTRQRDPLLPKLLIEVRGLAGFQQPIIDASLVGLAY